MRYNLKEILDLAETGKFAVPAFNVYNLETLMGVAHAVEETGAPVIFQMYSRLFDTETGKYMAPVIRDVVDRLKTPAALLGADNFLKIINSKRGCYERD